MPRRLAGDIWRLRLFHCQNDLSQALEQKDKKQKKEKKEHKRHASALL
jgi:hypothetical protein